MEKIKNENTNNKNKLVIMFSLIALITVILIAGVLFVIGTINKTEEDNKKILVENVSEMIPELKLELNTENPNQESVIIRVKAKTSDPAGIEKIKLPDGKEVVNNNETEFKVFENGEYEFTVIGANQKTTTNKIKVSNILSKTTNKPYIPKDFKHVEGDINTGYVIEDKYGNQYVWIPVPTGYVQRTNDTRYKDDEKNVLEFVNSVGVYKGFYVGRYEASKGNNPGNVSIKFGVVPWTNISFEDAKKYSEEMGSALGYSDVKTSLMSSFAWNTTLSAIDSVVNGFSTSTQNGNFGGNILKTGETAKDKAYNIFDLSGNVKEWNSEIYLYEEKYVEKEKDRYGDLVDVEKTRNIPNNILRGGSAGAIGVPAATTAYPLNINPDITFGFRPVLFKI